MITEGGHGPQRKISTRGVRIWKNDYGVYILITGGKKLEFYDYVIKVPPIREV